MGNYKIVYDKESCIGAGTCEAVSPDTWKVDNKIGKADLVGGVSMGNEMFELEIEDKDLDMHVQAARGCPAACIHIIDKRNGKRMD